MAYRLNFTKFRFNLCYLLKEPQLQHVLPLTLDSLTGRSRLSRSMFTFLRLLYSRAAALLAGVSGAVAVARAAACVSAAKRAAQSEAAVWQAKQAQVASMRINMSQLVVYLARFI
jgi:hypothetical protein